MQETRTTSWLTANVLIEQFGYDWASLMRFALFVMLFMAALYAAKATLASSILMAVLFAATKMPVF